MKRFPMVFEGGKLPDGYSFRMEATSGEVAIIHHSIRVEALTKEQRSELASILESNPEKYRWEVSEEPRP